MQTVFQDQKSVKLKQVVRVFENLGGDPTMQQWWFISTENNGYEEGVRYDTVTSNLHTQVSEMHKRVICACRHFISHGNEARILNKKMYEQDQILQSYVAVHGSRKAVRLFRNIM